MSLTLKSQTAFQEGLREGSMVIQLRVHLNSLDILFLDLGVPEIHAGLPKLFLRSRFGL